MIQKDIHAKISLKLKNTMAHSMITYSKQVKLHINYVKKNHAALVVAFVEFHSKI